MWETEIPQNGWLGINQLALGESVPCKDCDEPHILIIQDKWACPDCIAQYGIGEIIDTFISYRRYNMRSLHIAHMDEEHE